MTNLLFIFGLVALSVIIWCVYKELTYSQFQKTMKEGDHCRHEKQKAVIQLIGNNVVMIKLESGVIKKVFKHELKPL